MSLKSSSVFPVEIYETIIDIVGLDRALAISFPQSDYQHTTLRACCLTCRSWLPRARYHLYTTVLLNMGMIPTFVSSLSANPANGLLVKKLYVVDHWKYRSALSLIPLQFPQRLVNLEHVSLDRPRFGDVHTSFYGQLRKWKSVRSLVLHNAAYSSLDQVVRILTAFPNLRRLESVHSFHEGREVFSATLNRPFRRRTIRIPELELAGWFQFPESFLDLFSPRCITSLRIPCSFEYDNTPIASFIHECRYTLLHLVLDIKASAPPGEAVKENNVGMVFSRFIAVALHFNFVVHRPS